MTETLEQERLRRVRAYETARDPWSPKDIDRIKDRLDELDRQIGNCDRT